MSLALLRPAIGQLSEARIGQPMQGVTLPHLVSQVGHIPSRDQLLLATTRALACRSLLSVASLTP